MYRGPSDNNTKRDFCLPIFDPILQRDSCAPKIDIVAQLGPSVPLFDIFPMGSFIADGNSCDLSKTKVSTIKHETSPLKWFDQNNNSGSDLQLNLPALENVPGCGSYYQDAHPQNTIDHNSDNMNHLNEKRMHSLLMSNLLSSKSPSMSIQPNSNSNDKSHNMAFFCNNVNNHPMSASLTTVEATTSAVSSRSNAADNNNIYNSDSNHEHKISKGTDVDVGVVDASAINSNNGIVSSNLHMIEEERDVFMSRFNDHESVSFDTNVENSNPNAEQTNKDYKTSLGLLTQSNVITSGGEEPARCDSEQTQEINLFNNFNSPINVELNLLSREHTFQPSEAEAVEMTEIDTFDLQHLCNIPNERTFSLSVNDGHEKQKLDDDNQSKNYNFENEAKIKQRTSDEVHNLHKKKVRAPQ
ncbi:RNA-binding region RNP-1 domain-containing protein [Reticulomyxa filosa]|uniref:RNA-binding region RNP-1 domain-containing protein n=1 Tax=Reticulomyxa filosa TaxID=46433 RepID=X6NY55_RETFI|nr:RNA-binding region RNP-1 domain-containing protein [Reticulomyxa filosa]|eukprot:ETO30227.1 RNA-binding region RNP-1 domain-containing protein [Reticulomyxa filosa]